MKTENMKLGKLTRSISFTKAQVNEDDRTVEIAFSSEEPYERYYGVEILSHEKGACDLSRLNNKAPLLSNHWGQIGVVEEARIDSDKVGRAKVRFSRSAKGEEIFQDVVDGIRTKVSVGYTIKKMVLEEESEDGPNIYRAKKWEPYEVSIVSIPADDTVGVGRSGDAVDVVTEVVNTKQGDDESQKPKVKKMEEKEKKQEQVETTSVTVGVDLEQVKRDAANEGAERATKAFAKNVVEILAIGEQHGMMDEARSAVNDGLSVDAFRQIVLDKVTTKSSDAAGASAEDIGITEEEVKEYSILRAINAAANNDWSEAGFEREVSQAMQKQLDKQPQGFLVPYDVLAVHRDLTVGTPTAGGNLVADELRPSSFIDVLRSRMMVKQLGATVLDGLVGDIEIPRQTGAGTGYWLAEGDDTTESNQAFDQVTLTPRTVAGSTEISRKLRQQSAISVENLVRSDLAAVIARAIDLAAINGPGNNNQPLGILNTSGIGSVAMGENGDALTWAAVVALETEISIDNADIGTMAYLTNPHVRGAAKTIEKSNSTGKFLWEGKGEMNGYPAAVSTQVPANLTKGTSTDCSALILGVFDQLLIGVWGGLDILVNPYTGSKSGKLEITVFHDCDVAVRHPEAFAAIQDITTN